MKKEVFENGDDKSVLYYCFRQGFLCHFSAGNSGKRIKKYAFSNENALVWTGENENASLVENVLLRFRRDKKGILSKMHLDSCGLNPGISVVHIV